MKKHQKRQTMPKNWPVERKGTKFVIKGNSKGVPVLIALRDMLKIAQNRKEVKIAIHKKHLKINNKLVNDEKKNINLFDNLTIIPSKKYYKLGLSEKGKFELKEINEKQSKEKVSKVVNKKILKNKKIQLNLEDGKNYLSDIKVKTNDSVLINLEKNKVEKVIPLTEKSEILVIGGKHAGEIGTIKKIIPELKMVEVKTKDKDFRVLIKQLMVTK